MSFNCLLVRSKIDKPWILPWSYISILIIRERILSYIILKNIPNLFLHIELYILFWNHYDPSILFHYLLLFIQVNLLLSLCFETRVRPLLDILILLRLVLNRADFFLLCILLQVFLLLVLLLRASNCHHFWCNSVVAESVFLKRHWRHTFSRILVVKVNEVRGVWITVERIFQIFFWMLIYYVVPNMSLIHVLIRMKLVGLCLLDVLEIIIIE